MSKAEAAMPLWSFTLQLLFTSDLKLFNDGIIISQRNGVYATINYIKYADIVDSI